MDILFFAALAFYIFLKLNKNLGKIDDEEKKQIQEKIDKKRQEISEIQQQLSKQSPVMTVVNPGNKIHSTINRSDEIIATMTSLDENGRELLKSVLEKSQMTVDFFLSGAKSAFEMILKAFAAGDLEVLKFLLSEKIYQGFELAIKQRQTQEKKLITNLIAFDKVEIISAVMLDNTASVAVKIVSKQINYICNKDGEVVEGRKDEISEVIDVWTFTKDVTTSDPKWVVSVTAK